jgi:hypothetical protein
MNEENVVYTYIGTLLSQKSEILGWGSSSMTKHLLSIHRKKKKKAKKSCLL